MVNKIDILNRKEFVKQLISLTENISNNKKTTTFAINGQWGYGKSFVLDMLDEELQVMQCEKSQKEKYFIIRYNCWKYDYYDEPLIAIVTAILEALEEKTKIIDDEKKEKIKGVLKSIGVLLVSMTTNAIKEKTGMELLPIYSELNNGIKEGKNIYNENHEYDVYFSFNKVLKGLKDVLKEISEEYTIVLLIDELDRCLPEYAIKTLERLHHLTENTNNIISIVAIDKNQLQTSIKQIFGFDNSEIYLNKFIQFTVPLLIGEVSNKFFDKYRDYISMFDDKLINFPESVEDFIKGLFSDVDIRMQEQIMNRAKISHTLIFTEHKDYIFMCMEILITTLICHHRNNLKKPNRCFSYNAEKIFSQFEDKPYAFDLFFKEKMETAINTHLNQYGIIHYEIMCPNSLYAAILYLWDILNKDTEQTLCVDYLLGDGIYVQVRDNVDDLKKFIDTIYIVG